MPVDSTKRDRKLSYFVNTRGFPLRADVETSLGGDGSAPDPHDYLMAALASCTAITLQMYANRKGMPLQDVDVKVDLLEEGPRNRLRCDVRLIGPLTDEQKQALLTIAGKCPIHRFLERGATIESNLV